MSSTRDFKNPGIFAEAATTTIPPTPIQGVAYRDAVSGTDDVPNGWRYGTRVESQDWNQAMFLITSMLGMLDTKGVLGWTNLVNYTEAAIVFGSDGQLYTWLQESGPGTGAGVQDPVGAPLYWRSLNDTILNFMGQGGVGASDYIKIPFRDKTTNVKREFIIQWGQLSGAATQATFTHPIAFPNAALGALATDRSNSAGAAVIGLGHDAPGLSSTIFYANSASPVAMAATVVVFGY